MDYSDGLRGLILLYKLKEELTAPGRGGPVFYCLRENQWWSCERDWNAIARIWLPYRWILTPGKPYKRLLVETSLLEFLIVTGMVYPQCLEQFWVSNAIQG